MTLDNVHLDRQPLIKLAQYDDGHALRRTQRVLCTSLQRAAQQLSNEVQRKALYWATLLEPLLIVGMGAVVMLIVLAVMLPIIQLNQLVR